jgi:vacuolar-type H+-ATPase subunit C/Vma6
MNLTSFSHRVAEEDYTYLSGFLKARELRFLKPNDYVTMSRLMTLEDFFEFLPKFGYSVKSIEMDPVVFEKKLWKVFEDDLTSLSSLEPEPCLNPYLDSFRKILFWKSDEVVFTRFLSISKNGTDLTRYISMLVIDRFNFFEKLRSNHDKNSKWIFIDGGHFTKSNLDQLIDSSFQTLDLGTSYGAWRTFIDKESPVKQFDFEFTIRFETFWRSILQQSYQQAYYQTYGLDYTISYFLKWILEIEAILKVYFTLRFGLNFDLREELYLHVR